MTIVTLHAAGGASAEEAWERYAVPARWTQWSPQLRRVESTTPRIGPGTTGRVFGPAGIAARFVVDEVDEDRRRWTWTVRLGPVVLRLHHRVDARGAGCATALVVEGPLPVVVGYTPLAQFALHRLVRG